MLKAPKASRQWMHPLVVSGVFLAVVSMSLVVAHLLSLDKSKQSSYASLFFDGFLLLLDAAIVISWSNAATRPIPQAELPPLQQQPTVTSQAVSEKPEELPPFYHGPLFTLELAPKGFVSFVVPKPGESLYTCEDAHAFDVPRHVFAVADGVSTSFLPRPWASLLTQGFVEHPNVFDDEATFNQWMNDRCEKWIEWIYQQWLPVIYARNEQRGEHPADYTPAIQNKGAQATFIGVQLLPSPDGFWLDITAVGDCEAFIAQPGNDAWELTSCFPLHDALDFNNYPKTLSTKNTQASRIGAWAAKQHQRLEVTPRDIIVLQTDSLAKWVLTDAPARINQLLAIDTQSSFDSLVREEQLAHRLEDDDVTMLVIPIESLTAH